MPPAKSITSRPRSSRNSDPLASCTTSGNATATPRATAARRRATRSPETGSAIVGPRAQAFHHLAHDGGPVLEGAAIDALVGLVGLVQVAGTADERADAGRCQLRAVGGERRPRHGPGTQHVEQRMLQPRPTWRPECADHGRRVDDDRRPVPRPAAIAAVELRKAL